MIEVKNSIKAHQRINDYTLLLVNAFTLDIPHSLFWDIDLENFDNIRNRRLIIERVVTLGDLANLKEIIRFYGLKTIKEEIVNAGNLDKKTISWASLFFDIPKTNFRCYTKRQSNLFYP